MVKPSERRTATTLAFGVRLRTMRESAGLTQELLSHRTGLSVTYVASVERGERNIGLSNLMRLAAALDTPTSELVRDLPAPAPLVN